MNIYITGPYTRQEELKKYAAELKAMGHLVTSSWLAGELLKVDNPPSTEDIERDSKQAVENLIDILAANMIIVFTERTMETNYHVEFGAAAAKGKRLCVVGPRVNLFYCLPSVESYEAWEDVKIAVGVVN